MNPNTLLGLVLPEASAYLQARGLKAQVQVTGAEGCGGELPRVARITRKGEYYVLTVVYPPLLRLES